MKALSIQANESNHLTEFLPRFTFHLSFIRYHDAIFLSPHCAAELLSALKPDHDCSESICRSHIGGQNVCILLILFKVTSYFCPLFQTFTVLKCVSCIQRTWSVASKKPIRRETDALPCWMVFSRVSSPNMVASSVDPSGDPAIACIGPPYWMIFLCQFSQLGGFCIVVDPSSFTNFVLGFVLHLRLTRLGDFFFSVPQFGCRAPQCSQTRSRLF